MPATCAATVTITSAGIDSLKSAFDGAADEPAEDRGE